MSAEDDANCAWAKETNEDSDIEKPPLNEEAVVTNAEAINDESIISMPLLAVKNTTKTQVQHLKNHLSDRGIPVSSTKYVLIERLSKASNDNVVTIDPEKIVAPLPVPKPTKNARNIKARGERQGQEVHVDLAWIPLEEDENSTTVSANIFVMQHRKLHSRQVHFYSNRKFYQKK